MTRPRSDPMPQTSREKLLRAKMRRLRSAPKTNERSMAMTDYQLPSPRQLECLSDHKLKLLALAVAYEQKRREEWQVISDYALTGAK